MEYIILFFLSRFFSISRCASSSRGNGNDVETPRYKNMNHSHPPVRSLTSSHLRTREWWRDEWEDVDWKNYRNNSVYFTRKLREDSRKFAIILCNDVEALGVTREIEVEIGEHWIAQVNRMKREDYVKSNIVRRRNVYVLHVNAHN